MPLTLKNNSTIRSNVIIDIRLKNLADDIKCLDLEYLPKKEDEDDAVIYLDRHPNMQEQLNSDDDEENEISNPHKKLLNENKGRLLKLKLKATSTLDFKLIFIPISVKSYKLKLPISMVGQSEDLKGL